MVLRGWGRGSVGLGEEGLLGLGKKSFLSFWSIESYLINRKMEP